MFIKLYSVQGSEIPTCASGCSSSLLPLLEEHFYFEKMRDEDKPDLTQGNALNFYTHMHKFSPVYLHLLIETCTPIAGCVHGCVRIRMLQHTHAVHCQRCPLSDLGRPWRLHYHINYIHVVAGAVD